MRCRIAEKQYLVVASTQRDSGAVYYFSFDPVEGGPATLVRQLPISLEVPSPAPGRSQPTPGVDYQAGQTGLDAAQGSMGSLGTLGTLGSLGGQGAAAAAGTTGASAAQEDLESAAEGAQQTP